jgi:hypothetical protein
MGETVEEKEWTLMFYFASDNPLAPGIVSQLKSIKNAGFHPDANVIAHFDPQTEGTPTHIFDVNLIYKLENKLEYPPNGKPDIGFASNDPVVRNLMEDKLWFEDQTDRGGEQIKKRISETIAKGLDYNPPEPPDFRSVVEPAKQGYSEPKEAGNGEQEKADDHDKKIRNRGPEIDPEKALRGFLKFCREKYRARHYMLFIIGHGVVVGNDVFLFDEHVSDKHSLKLKEFGKIIDDFKGDLDKDTLNNPEKKAQFELISLHSCSMSGVEVAYELQGKANYLLASQGPAFVGSWPYRQILIRIFNDLDNGRLSDKEIRKTIALIFYCCLNNSTDFMLAGYSFDLCLCDLNKVPALTDSIRKLSGKLVEGLKSHLLRNYILAAHLKAQSFWQESYTDLYDFCFCLNKRCADFKSDVAKLVEAGIPGEGATNAEAEEAVTIERRLGFLLKLVMNTDAGELIAAMTAIQTAAGEVMKALTKETDGGTENIIIRSEFAGPAYQYSHGLSVFFPWAAPSGEGGFMKEYACYEFSKKTDWHKFLDEYFRITMRDTRKDEPDASVKHVRVPNKERDDEEELREDMVSLLYNSEGALSLDSELANGEKTRPRDPTGDDCTCPTIKNYPRDTRARSKRGKEAKPELLPTGQIFFTGM